LQSDFLRNVSHEVRTPLASVLGFAEILTERMPSHDAMSRKFAGQITLAGQNLTDIFTNILTFSAMESSPPEISLERMMLPLVLTDIQRIFTPQAALKGLVLDCTWSSECEQAMMLDTEYVRDILRHLVSNAIKFTEHGLVQVRCKLDKKETTKEQYLQVLVRDTGIGIAPEFLSMLFLPFHQHDGSKNRTFGGLGLGLAITKRLVDAMCGSIHCESESGNGLLTGTMFIVELPVVMVL
jgi:signal transduction histidine kinase